MTKQAQVPQTKHPKIWTNLVRPQSSISATEQRRQSQLLLIFIILLDAIGVLQTLLWLTEPSVSDVSRRIILLCFVVFQILAFALYRLNQRRESGIAALIQSVAMLSEEKTLLRLLIDHLPENIYVKDRNSQFLLNNTTSLRILGVSRQEELVGKSDFDFFSPDLAKVWHTNEQTVMQAGQPIIDAEEFQPWNAHERRWVAASYIPLRDAHGTVIGFVGINRDISEYKRVEEALRASETRFRTLIEQSPVAIVVSRNGVISYVNPTWLRAIGCPGIDEAAHRLLSDFIAPAYRQESLERTQRRALGLPTPTEFETVALRADGSEFPVHATIAQVQLADGPANVTFITDITERKQTEEREHAITRGLRAVVEAADELISIQDVDTFHRRVVELGREKLKLERTGLVLLDPTGQYFQATYGTNGAGQTIDEHTRVVPTSEHPQFSDPNRRSWVHETKPLIYWDGQQVKEVCIGWSAETAIRIGEEPIGLFFNDTAISGAPLDPAQQETVILYCSLLGNILERKRAEEAVRQSETRYRRISELISDYAFAYKVLPDGSFTTDWITDDSFTRLTGYRWQEINNTFKLYHPDDALLAQEDVAQVMKGQSVQGEYRIITKSGELRWLQLQRQAEWDESAHRVIRFYGAAEDITERKQAEAQIRKLNAELEQRVAERTAQLEAANQELEAFAYSVSHDLRAPLRAMDGFARTLMDQYQEALPEKGRHFLDRIQHNAQRMGLLIDDLLMLSRMSRQELKTEVIDLNSFVRGLIADMTIDKPLERTQIVIGDLPRCNADASLLRQVWYNLIANAIKYSGKRPEPHVEIGYQRDNDQQIIYYVKDNGVGFDMRFADKLFGVFQRLHSPREYEGTGIGLAIVHRIVQRHGGRAWAEAAVDRGATFYFTLGVPVHERTT